MAAWADKDQRRRNAELLARLSSRSGSTLYRTGEEARTATRRRRGSSAVCLRALHRALPGALSAAALAADDGQARGLADRQAAHRRRELAITAAPRADGQGTADLTDAFPDPDADPFERACRDQFTEDSRAAFEHLKPDQRLALLLLGLGYSYAEIAESCGWTTTKVNRCLSEGRAALREIMAEADRMSTSTQQPGKSRLDSKPETTVQGGTR